MSEFRYAQFCPLARAAEVVGERWTLLIARELLLGPKRFSDLRGALAGVSSSVLADRLARLERREVVAWRRLPPPAAARVYELTETGRALEPVVLALARYFHGLTLEEVRRPLLMLPPLLLVLVPAALMLRQPDLGTAILILVIGGALFLLAGVRLWMFVAAFGACMAAIPLGWQFLHGYQQERILTFLNPERDPLGAGYHILQSKIALGSGGLAGKGFLGGTQSHLSFLPEMQTDFIFTMLAEEFGMIGGLVLLGLYAILLIYGLAIALRSRNQFGRLLAVGIACNIFLYVFINIAMVMGLVPVVGVPLPLVSYGGTSMLTMMVGLGLVLNAHVNRRVFIRREEMGPLW